MHLFVVCISFLLLCLVYFRLLSVYLLNTFLLIPVHGPSFELYSCEYICFGTSIYSFLYQLLIWWLCFGYLSLLFIYLNTFVLTTVQGQLFGLHSCDMLVCFCTSFIPSPSVSNITTLPRPFPCPVCFSPKCPSHHYPQHHSSRSTFASPSHLLCISLTTLALF